MKFVQQSRNVNSVFTRAISCVSEAPLSAVLSPDSAGVPLEQEFYTGNELHQVIELSQVYVRKPDVTLAFKIKALKDRVQIVGVFRL